jgi:transposase
MMHSKSRTSERRRLGVQMVLRGISQAKVAQVMSVSVRSVGKWMVRYRQGGETSLATQPGAGRRPKLANRQEQAILRWFEHPATHYGFPTDLWTARRVAQLIEKKFGVHFNHRYLNQWLTERNITSQKPERVPRERDQAKIDRWVRHDWPRIKKSSPTPGVSGSHR